MVTKYTAGGKVYNAISAAAWSGAEGDALRAQGWTYYGFGTGGVYITPPGGQPFTMQPNILPPVSPEEPPTTSGQSAGAVADKACGSCRKPAAPASSPITGNTAPAVSAAARPVSRSGLPWWLYVLAALTLAQVVYGRNN